MPKTDAQRRREADARKRAAGLTRVSVWIPAESKGVLKDYAENRCRDHFRLEREKQTTLSNEDWKIIEQNKPVLLIKKV